MPKAATPSLTTYLSDLANEPRYWSPDQQPLFELQAEDYTEQNLNDLQRYTALLEPHGVKKAIFDALITRLETYFTCKRLYQAYLDRTLAETDIQTATVLCQNGDSPHLPTLSKIPADTDKKIPAVHLLSLDWQAYDRNYPALEQPEPQIIRAISLLEAVMRTINAQDITVIHLQQATSPHIEPLLRLILGKAWACATDGQGLISLYHTHAFKLNNNPIIRPLAIGETLSLKLQRQDLSAPDSKIYVINHQCPDHLPLQQLESGVQKLLLYNQQYNEKGANQRSAIWTLNHPEYQSVALIANSKGNQRISDHDFVDLRTRQAFAGAVVPCYKARIPYKRQLRWHGIADTGFAEIRNHPSARNYEQALTAKFPHEDLQVRLATDKDGNQALSLDFSTETSTTYIDLKTQLASELSIRADAAIITIPVAAMGALKKAVKSLDIRNRAIAAVKQQQRKLLRGSIIAAPDESITAAVAKLIEWLQNAAPGSSVEQFSLIVREWEKELRAAKRDLQGGTPLTKVLIEQYDLLNPVNNLRLQLIQEWKKEHYNLENVFLYHEENHHLTKIQIEYTLLKSLNGLPGNQTYADLCQVFNEPLPNALPGHDQALLTKRPLFKKHKTLVKEKLETKSSSKAVNLESQPGKGRVYSGRPATVSPNSSPISAFNPNTLFSPVSSEQDAANVSKKVSSDDLESLLGNMHSHSSTDEAFLPASPEQGAVVIAQSNSDDDQRSLSEEPINCSLFDEETLSVLSEHETKARPATNTQAPPPPPPPPPKPPVVSAVLGQGSQSAAPLATDSSSLQPPTISNDDHRLS